jgi:small subunit ribosomal protein S1
MKRLRPNPWQVLSEKIKVGDVVEAPVMRIADFGVFISLDGGISGLIHLSEISHSMVKNIDDFVKVGQVIKAKVITFDPIAKRIGLSMKALEEAPKKEEKAEEKVEDKNEEKTEKKTEKKAEKKSEKKVEAPVADFPTSEEVASIKKERKPRKKASDTTSEDAPKAE